MVAAGFDGVEATVRKGGIIAPAAAANELPKFCATLRENGCGVTLIATDINGADDPLSEKVLRTAAEAGIKYYRTAYYRYDLKKPVRPQVENYRAAARDLAAMNKELGITGVYQNHVGAPNLGASLWDLDDLLEDIDPDHLGVAFDIRHATAEGGTTWPLLWKLIEQRVRMVYVKDFVWKGRKPQNVALGEGQVDRAFFTKLTNSGSQVPISVHVEYLHKGGVDANVAALKSDRETLAKWLTKE